MLPLIGCVITVSALTHLNIGFHAPFWFPSMDPLEPLSLILTLGPVALKTMFCCHKLRW